MCTEYLICILLFFIEHHLYHYSLMSAQSQQKARNNTKSICVYTPKQHHLFNLTRPAQAHFSPLDTLSSLV